MAMTTAGEHQTSEARVAVVTGAASGIGFAYAEAFARSGYDVAILDVRDDVHRAAERLSQRAAGSRHLSLITDVGDEGSVIASTAEIGSH